MKFSSTSLVDALKTERSINSNHRVIAEWNMNRYVTANATVNANNQYMDAFPLSSIISAERPTKSGIVKIATDNGIIAEPVDNLPARYYPVASDDPYQYWISQPATNIFAVGGGYQFSVEPVITIDYSSPVKTNKIYMLVENNFNTPMAGNISIRTTLGGPWQTISSNFTFDSNGIFQLFYQGDSWNTNKNTYLSQQTVIYGIKLTFASVSKSQQPMALIEVSPRLVQDLSDYVIDLKVDEELSDVSFISPIGAASSNQASLTLSNVDNRFNTTNIYSPYYNILDKNVLITGEIAIKNNGVFEYIRMFTMYTQSWSGQTNAEVQVSLEDDSSRMKIVTPPQILLQSLTVGQVISILCDTLGFTNYKYTDSTLDISQTIDYFFTDKEKTLWEIISELSVGTQTVVYFDAFNVMQIKSRNVFLNSGRDSTWTINYEKNGTNLPDLIDYSEEYQLEANSVDVVYTPTHTSDFNNGQPKMESVWEPEDTLVLRAGSLESLMSISDMYFYLSSDKATTWPYEGLVNIDSEVIRLRGKEYRYWTSVNTSNFVVIYSQEEKDKFDAMTPDTLTYRNKFTGRMIVIQRGVNATPISAHYQSSNTENSWTGYIVEDGVSTPWIWQGGITNGSSLMTLTTNYTFKETNNYCARSNSFANPAPGTKVNFGTRIRFREGYSPNNVGEAGIFFASNPSSFVGYWVSLRLTEAVEATNRYRNEVAIWGKMGDYWTTTYDHKPLEIRRGVWYDVDVTFEITSTHDHIITVFVNGVVIAQTTLAGNNRIITGGGQHGVQVGNFSSADFEYYYSAQGDASYAPDTSTLYDEIKGGFSNGVVQSNWYKTAFYDDLGGLSGTKALQGAVFFDDFGSIVHEIREFDVSYEKPVLYSKPYVTNEQVFIPAFYSDPFGAHFVMVNAGRGNAIVKGDDSETYGSDNVVTQSAFIYGRQIYQDNTETINVYSQPNINRRGIQKTQFSNQYLQNKTTGQELANWVVKQWGSTIKTVEVEVFGNPLLEVGDIIKINYVAKDIYDKKYYVNKVSNAYQKGLVTNLSLRTVTDDVLVSQYSQNTGSSGKLSGQYVYISD